MITVKKIGLAKKRFASKALAHGQNAHANAPDIRRK
jgi:hypothetical protein